MLPGEESGVSDKHTSCFQFRDTETSKRVRAYCNTRQGSRKCKQPYLQSPSVFPRCRVHRTSKVTHQPHTNPRQPATSHYVLHKSRVSSRNITAPLKTKQKRIQNKSTLNATYASRRVEVSATDCPKIKIPTASHLFQQLGKQ